MRRTAGKIVDPQTRFWHRQHRAADQIVDCDGMILAPGMIDVQV